MRESAQEITARLREAAFEDVERLVASYADDDRQQVQKAVAAAKRRHEKERGERDRVTAMYALQRELGGEGVVVGVDEVGRGAIAGPLTVCAVALPDEPMIWGLNDSKQLSPQRREELAARIREVALAIGVAHIAPHDIDLSGMAASLRQAMAQAVVATGVEPDCVLIDGNPVHAHPKEKTLVKGDARIACIAAASIVAKVTRDAMMVELSERYPGYHLDACKGYGSAEHIAAIRAQGLTDIHRVSFCGNFVEMPTLF
jgi:ribonuclease HII